MLMKNPAAGCSKRPQSQDARKSISGGVLLLYVDAKSVERNEGYESFSATCWMVDTGVDGRIGFRTTRKLTAEARRTPSKEEV
jgi:hypothetical protein